MSIFQKPRSSAGDTKVKALFGLRPQQDWPSEGLDPIIVDGWQVWVNPLTPLEHRRKFGGIRRHRVMTRCPICAQAVSAGRTMQHYRIHQSV